jgi:hypothetical protein
VYDAAEVMGVTVDTIRKRVSRGTIPHERDQPQSDVTALISAKDETIAALREQLEQANERDRENRHILAALTARIPAIEALADERGLPETVEQETEGTEPRSDAPGTQESAERPWWRRWFGS